MSFAQTTRKVFSTGSLTSSNIRDASSTVANRTRPIAGLLDVRENIGVPVCFSQQYKNRVQSNSIRGSLKVYKSDPNYYNLLENYTIRLALSSHFCQFPFVKKCRSKFFFIE